MNHVLGGRGLFPPPIGDGNVNPHIYKKDLREPCTLERKSDHDPSRITLFCEQYRMDATVSSDGSLRTHDDVRVWRKEGGGELLIYKGSLDLSGFASGDACTVVSEDGSMKYEGSMSLGVPHGTGGLTLMERTGAPRVKYIGTWCGNAYGQMEVWVFCECHWERVFKGKLVAGYPHGDDIAWFTLASNSSGIQGVIKYEGSCRRGEMHGWGNLIMHGLEFKGVFVKDRMMTGTVFYPDGLMISFDRSRNEEYVVIYPNGDTYTGHMNESMRRHGWGTYTHCNGEKLIGNFHDDDFVGGDSPRLHDVVHVPGHT